MSSRCARTRTHAHAQHDDDDNVCLSRELVDTTAHTWIGWHLSAISGIYRNLYPDVVGEFPVLGPQLGEEKLRKWGNGGDDQNNMMISDDEEV